ncbi:hypothetical protein EYZ11_010024 [Aspergillus tanneri]|uniref:Uncharacterized protein n=1 Tax=Aspergillus tanneri TaxID=1220188 RepID=A0A4S3JBS6_9EURO|nr:hypothetical protein EYZ11_010024 [Aspergillus tanneri]
MTTGIHTSFANQDRVSAMIQKAKISLFPEGQELNGLRFECLRRPELRSLTSIF